MDEHKSFKCRQVTLRCKDTGEQIVFETMTHLQRSLKLSLHRTRKLVNERLDFCHDGKVYEIVDVRDTDKTYGTKTTNRQPCFKCKNFAGGCSWSRSLTPVKGWEAEAHVINGNIWSWAITYCPEYEQG